MKTLKGRVALITGAGRGIGKAIALAFSRQGASLVLASRTGTEIEGVARHCLSFGTGCSAIVTDVRLSESVCALVASTLERFGRLDVLVNAAGVHGPIGPIEDIDLESWRHAIEVNLLGTMHMCHYVVRAMSKQRSGSIINFSGGGATSPLPRFSAYGVSKAAVVRLTETIAREVADRGIRVNAIAPGAVDTTLQDDVIEAGDRAGDLYKRMLELRRTGAGATSIDVPVDLAVFLASDASKGLTGRLISAPHDPWHEWDATRIRSIANSPWYTLRRLDPFTVSPLKDQLP